MFGLFAIVASTHSKSRKKLKEIWDHQTSKDLNTATHLSMIRRQENSDTYTIDKLPLMHKTMRHLIIDQQLILRELNRKMNTPISDDDEERQKKLSEMIAMIPP